MYLNFSFQKSNFFLPLNSLNLLKKMFLCFDYSLYYLYFYNYLPKKTISNKFHGILKYILYNPFITFIILLLLYPLLCLFILPFYIINYYIHINYILFFLILILIYFIRYFTIYFIFPGSLNSLKRKISKEYLKSIIIQYNKLSHLINNFSSSFIHLSSGIGNNLSLKLYEFDTLVNKSLPILIIVLKEGLESLDNQVFIFTYLFTYLFICLLICLLTYLFTIKLIIILN